MNLRGNRTFSIFGGLLSGDENNRDCCSVHVRRDKNRHGCEGEWLSTEQESQLLYVAYHQIIDMNQPERKDKITTGEQTTYDDFSYQEMGEDLFTNLGVEVRDEEVEEVTLVNPAPAVSLVFSQTEETKDGSKRAEKAVKKSPRVPRSRAGVKLRAFRIIFICMCWGLHGVAGSPVHIPTSQVFSSECTILLNQMEHCARLTSTDLPKWRDLGKVCCDQYKLKYHCQVGEFKNGTQYIIQACMKEMTVEPGTTVKLVTDDQGTPHFAISDCEDGYYETRSRKSFDVLSPGCLAKYNCSAEKGQRLMRGESKTADNVCDCLPEFRYIGDTFNKCREGFTENSICECQPCPAGTTRNDTNLCVSNSTSVGELTSKEYTTTPKVIPTSSRNSVEHGASKPTRNVYNGENSAGKGSMTDSRVHERVCAIIFLILFMVGVIALFLFERFRNTVRLLNGLNV